MTPTIAQLRDRLGGRFDDAEQVDKTIVRFTRKVNGQAFALYYVDVGTELPQTAEELSAYQDRVLGAKYFGGRKSLQWNNYLYFVVGADRAGAKDAGAAKALIEADRTYARKYVVVESELDAALEPPQVPATALSPEANILSLWLAKLAGAGLDAAVLSDKPLPGRLSQLEATAGIGATLPKTPHPQQPVARPPFLKRIQFATYRAFPVQRTFELGSVNLVVGPNGTGKTSLLEAIELLYCGRNKRNPDDTAAYALIAEYVDGSNETVNNTRRPNLFRDRNLQWYGQAEVKTNNLFASFSLFNFLDTDAAVRLADSTTGLEEALSNLLVGAEASKTWREIGRFHEAVNGKIRELQLLETQLKDELAAIEMHLQEAAAVRQESDSIFAQLEDMSRRLQWELPTKEMATGHFLESLTEVTSLSKQAAAFHWAESPVSVDKLMAYSCKTKHVIEKCDLEATRLEELRAAEQKATEAAMRCERALPLVDEAGRIIDADLPARAMELKTCQDTVAALTGMIAGCNDALLTRLNGVPREATVEAFVASAAAARASAEAVSKAAKQEYEAFARLRQVSDNLAQQLREIAGKLLGGNTKPDECPLCHTQFDPGQLAKRMQSGVDQHVESCSQLLLAQSRRSDEMLNNALAAEVASRWLKAFCDQAALGVTTSVGNVLAKLSEVRRTLVDAEQRNEALISELKVLRSHGLSSTRMDEIAAALQDAGYPLREWTSRSVEQVRVTIESDRTSFVAALADERMKREALQRSLVRDLGISAATPESLKSAVSELKERRVVAASLLSKLALALKSFPWPAEDALSELTVESEAVRAIATELQLATGREQQAKATLSQAAARRGHVAKKLADLSARNALFVKAGETLAEIQSKYSLTSAMESALKRNRAGIEAIFGRIHSPAEFAGLGRGVSSLVRKNGGTEAALNQISTGQRAAFALSIFLAHNAQLRSAPPVMLIDDPIAHIDDLNALSFLDYLREVALSGDRQIVFATASEKLATLFERKFDFLGHGFRRHDLHR